MFIGRKRELHTWSRLYHSDQFEFVVIYGRRRVGKTALIGKFTEDKKNIYFTGIESSEKQNLQNLTQSILEYIGETVSDISFQSFQAALEYIFRLSENERIIMTIDEYPYVARSSLSLASTLQLLIDKYKDRSKLMLILCGSSMSYMEDNVLAYKAPLYGRRTSQMKIQPFDFFETCQYFQKFSSEEKALIYGIAGGTPQYLFQMNDELSIKENIKNTFLDPTSFLFEEPVNLLKQEVREPSVYNAVITAIAAGSSKLSEISTKIGESTSICSAYIKNLVSLGIIKKEMPYGENTSKKTIYSLEDNMFRFWYRFVPNNSSIIARGASDLAYKRIEPFLSDYMGGIFEEICKQYLWKLLLSEKSPIEFNDLGRWWGNDPKQKKQVEIDIIGSADKYTALFGECKWTNEKVDLNVLDTLIERSNLFTYSNKYFYLFSKSGFTKSCIDKASSMPQVNLITYSQIESET